MGTQLQARQDRPAHLAPTRTRAFPSPRAEARARRHRPVFVDDSGRRRRVARFVGTAVGLLALAYTAVVALTFTGAASLRAPGLDPLTHPAGHPADVGPRAVEQAVPAAIGTPDGPHVSDSGDHSAPPLDASSTTAPRSALLPTTPTRTAPTTSAPAPTVPATTTTTAVAHGHSPNSTIPTKGGGPPTSKPNG